MAFDVPSEKNPQVAAPSADLTRTGIMKALLPVVTNTLKGIAGLDLNDHAALRRTFRAIVTLGVCMMLDAGAPPEFVVQQAIEALTHEIEERNKARAEMGATQAPASC